MSKGDEYSRRLARHKDRLTPAMLRAAHFIDQNRADVLLCSAAELARLTQASDATIVRTAQAMGFEGLAGMRAALAASLGGAPSPVQAELLTSLGGVGADVDRAVAKVLGNEEK